MVLKVIVGVVVILGIYKWFIYYCAGRGLLYYLAIKYDDMPNENKMKELTEMAVKRTIKEFFRLD